MGGPGAEFGVDLSGDRRAVRIAKGKDGSYLVFIAKGAGGRAHRLGGGGDTGRGLTSHDALGGRAARGFNIAFPPYGHAPASPLAFRLPDCGARAERCPSPAPGTRRVSPGGRRTDYVRRGRP